LNVGKAFENRIEILSRASLEDGFALQLLELSSIFVEVANSLGQKLEAILVELIPFVVVANLERLQLLKLWNDSH
jgi:hypothetical protein